MRREDVVDISISPVIKTTPKFYVAFIILLILVVLGFLAYITQFIYGHGVTGLNSNVIWGSYIAVFIFFIAISMSGTLVSALLRITRAKWGTTIARLAEMITASAFIIAVLQILIDIGRPDRILHAIIWGRLQSPITWDIFVIMTYAVASYIYLYITMIPDLALIWREGRVKGLIAQLYQILSINWIGTKEQVTRLNKAIKILAVMLIPTAVAFHSIVSWILAMLNRPGWHTTVMGPDFVTAAIYSAMAMLIVIIWIFTKTVDGASKLIKEIHFRYLGYLLFVSCLALIYMKICHILTEYYGGEEMHVKVLNSLLFGDWAPVFWGFMILSLIGPAVILPVILFREKLSVNGLFVMSVLIIVGLYLDRLYLVASPLSITYLPYPYVSYTPTLVEISLLIASFSGFALIYLVLIKVFPSVCIWETTSEGEGGINLIEVRREELFSNPLPRLILILSIICYVILMYIIVRFFIIPIYVPEGYVALSETFKLAAVPVAIVVSIAWISIMYSAYQLVKISEVGE